VLPTEEPATTEPASEPENEPRAAAGIEPAIVAAGVFDTAPAESPALATEEPLPTEPVSAESAPAEPVAIETEPVSATDAPAIEQLPAVEEAPSAPEDLIPEASVAEPATTADAAQEASATEVTTADQEMGEAPRADAEGEPPTEAAPQGESESALIPADPAAWAAFADQGSAEAVAADAVGEPIQDEPVISAPWDEAVTALGEATPAPETSSGAEGESSAWA